MVIKKSALESELTIGAESIAREVDAHLRERYPGYGSLALLLESWGVKNKVQLRAVVETLLAWDWMVTFSDEESSITVSATGAKAKELVEAAFAKSQVVIDARLESYQGDPVEMTWSEMLIPPRYDLLIRRVMEAYATQEAGWTVEFCTIGGTTNAGLQFS